MAPRDRWIGASPGGNVTPAGQALEALDAVRTACEEARDGDVQPHVRWFALELLEVIDRITVAR